jgi:hypothetical protein
MPIPSKPMKYLKNIAQQAPFCAFLQDSLLMIKGWIRKLE